MTEISRMAGSIYQPTPLTNWVSISAALVAGATVTQNSRVGYAVDTICWFLFFFRIRDNLFLQHFDTVG